MGTKKLKLRHIEKKIGRESECVVCERDAHLRCEIDAKQMQSSRKNIIIIIITLTKRKRETYLHRKNAAKKK